MSQRGKKELEATESWRDRDNKASCMSHIGKLYPLSWDSALTNFILHEMNRTADLKEPNGLDSRGLGGNPVN